MEIILYNISKEELIKFENDLIEEYSKGNIPSLMHFCGGNEDQLIEIFKDINEGDYIFSTHRNHYHFLLAGAPPEKVFLSIKKGDSMYSFSRELNFLSTSILAGGCCIAAGVAMALKKKNSSKRVWCFIGDGSEDEGHFYEAVYYVAGWDLPCTFIIEDNDCSVSTSIKDRRGAKNIIKWPKKYVKRYYYKPTHPHIGLNGNPFITFSKESIDYYFKNKH